MLPLPAELRDALAAAGGGPVRLTDPETQAEYVLLPAEDFDRPEPLVEYDDSPWTAEEKRAALGRLGKRIGWDDPEMDVYDELDHRRLP